MSTNLTFLIRSVGSRCDNSTRMQPSDAVRVIGERREVAVQHGLPLDGPGLIVRGRLERHDTLEGIR